MFSWLNEMRVYSKRPNALKKMIMLLNDNKEPELADASLDVVEELVFVLLDELWEEELFDTDVIDALEWSPVEEEFW